MTKETIATATIEAIAVTGVIVVEAPTTITTVRILATPLTRPSPMATWVVEKRVQVAGTATGIKTEATADRPLATPTRILDAFDHQTHRARRVEDRQCVFVKVMNLY